MRSRSANITAPNRTRSFQPVASNTITKQVPLAHLYCFSDRTYKF